MKNLMIAITALFASFLLTGCPGPDDSGDTDDTGDGFGAILATLEVDGVDIDTDIEAISESDPQEAYVGMTDEPLEVPAGSWIVRGGSDPPTADGLPTILVDSLPWVAPPTGTSVSKDSEKPVSLIANRYFENSDLICHSSSGTDFDENRVYVKDGYKLELTKTLGQGSWLEVEVDKMTLYGQRVSMGQSLTANQSIGVDTLSFQLDDGTGTVFTYTCD